MARYQVIPSGERKALMPIIPVLIVTRPQAGVQCHACTGQADVSLTAGWKQTPGPGRLQGQAATIRLCGNCARIMQTKIGHELKR